MPDEATQLLPGRPGPVGPVLAPGTLLLHTYQVERMLACGGMGEVYLARHGELGTRHAIKVIRPQLSGTEAVTDLAELFRREALALSSIRHEAVVGYEGFFRDGHRTSYLVMEYVAGPSLAQVLRARALASDEVYRLRDRVADGLAAAHARGVIHRDLAPDNIILPGGEVDCAKVIDFGISKRADSAGTTIIGNTFAGKLRFAAPEQLGLAGGQIGPTADIYSLALVLAAAAGTPLGMGDTLASAVQARQRVPDLTRVPAWLRPQLAAMLAPDPARRPASLSEVLRRWPRPDAAPPRRRADARRHWLRRGAVLALPAAGGLALLLIWFAQQVPGPPDPGAATTNPPHPESVPAAALASRAPPGADRPVPRDPERPEGTAASAGPPAAPQAPAAQPQQQRSDPPGEAPRPPAGMTAQTAAASRPDRPGPALTQPRARGATAPGRCRDLLLKAQLGEPLSGNDRVALASCR